MPPNEDERAQNKQEQPGPSKFHITDPHLGEGSAKEKYGHNVDAIRTLRQIEKESRVATSTEQAVLSCYVGWGGLPQAFDNGNSSWSKEYAELKNLLTEDEYNLARASTLNAHYTSPIIIKAIYDALEHMDFTINNILEPACGTGHFFGMLPASLQDANLYGVELDSITGRIAKQLYPSANISVTGFEKTELPDSFFDLAIGNVPFGNYKLSEKRYDNQNFLIHDHFFAKALDKVRPGGVVAFITSKGTMDKQYSGVRRYLAQRAELLGAVRLPNNAFLKNAGTEVTSDILFLQKRDRAIDVDPDWIHLGTTESGIVLNSYFADHPEMILGIMEMKSGQFGMESICIPLPSADLAEQLKAAMANMEGNITDIEFSDVEASADTSIPAGPNVKNFTYTLVNGEVYYRENSRMVIPEVGQEEKERIAALVELRECVNDLIHYQLEDYDEDTIKQEQATLNRLYDCFTAKYGLINSRENGLAFGDDHSYYLLCSLENVDENGNLKSKADLFTKRTIKKRVAVTSVDTASEALALSIAEKAQVDLVYMTALTGGSEKQIVAELRGVIFPLPGRNGANNEPRYVTADEYLSGNVREKLKEAQLAADENNLFQLNVDALIAAQPKDLDATEIDIRLGATWVDRTYIQQFMYEQFNTPRYLQGNIEVKYASYTAEWNVTGKSSIGHNDVAVYIKYGTDRANAYKILEDTLNLRDVRIFDTVSDPEGKERRILNQKATTLAQQKQQAIKNAFIDWVWKEPHRRQTLVKQYNEQFNAIRPREYEGRHITLSGMNSEISLREHQRNAVARILYGGNTLLAHEVGAGKTFEMIAAAMESKRLGLCQKSLFAVPNHLTEQWASEFLKLYPAANILVAKKKDFEMKNRKKFCARIATGEYDAVIMGFSQFERIPISTERQERLLREQINEIICGIEEVKASGGERFTVKQLERTKKSVEVQLEKLLANDRKDDVISFEQLGIDRLFIDEAHHFKNLFLNTKMRNVAGLPTNNAQKSFDLFLKCRYMDEITGGKGIIFATGTPISNSMNELYTMMRYLQYSELERRGLIHFDCWASTFGETATVIELAPEGTGYRARTRFAKFFNLPELMNLFKETADIKIAEQLNLPIPKATYSTVLVQPTDHQRELVAELSVRAASIHGGSVDPHKDNMLKITSDGRKIGLDQRLINPLLPDDPGSKVNSCVNHIFHIWDEGQADRLTQLVFCDISTPKNDGQFSVYKDIRIKLTQRGIPKNQIAFIHEANTEVKQKELFAKVRIGQVRILLSSTSKMGAGTNVQDRLVAIHDLDCPWRPGDLEQRKGRIVRQGNKNKEVFIYRYVTEATFDAYLYQTIENKQKFISQIMTSKVPVRSYEDVDETVLSYAEIKALCAGNPMIKEKMDLDIELARLKLLKADHQGKQYHLENQLLTYFPENIAHQRETIKGFEQDIKTLKLYPHCKESFVGIEIQGKQFKDKNEAGTELLTLCQEIKDHKPIEVGIYRGFSMLLFFDSLAKEYLLILKGEMNHRVTLGTDARGNLLRMDHALDGIPDRLESIKMRLDQLHQQQAAAKLEIGKPFEQEEELIQKSARLAELDAMLNLNTQTELLEEKGVDENKEELVGEPFNMKSQMVDTHKKDEIER